MPLQHPRALRDGDGRHTQKLEPQKWSKSSKKMFKFDRMFPRHFSELAFLQDCSASCESRKELLFKRPPQKGEEHVVVNLLFSLGLEMTGCLVFAPVQATSGIYHPCCCFNPAASIKLVWLASKMRGSKLILFDR